MDSWNYVNGGKRFAVPDANNVTTSPSKNSWMSYGNINNNLLVSGHSWIENHGFGDSTRHPLDICSKIGDGSRLMNPVMVNANAFCGEERLSGSVVHSSNSGVSSLIDLQLGRLADQKDPKNAKDYQNTLPKRLRMGGLNSQVAYCQVHGCNKDLSASKEYHRRHKVCEIHSKTAKVIVNGIEKRFCQQCSRFHVLAEFDDGKRSCRKRLAGHNERRRKPQVGGHGGRSGRFLPSCYGLTGSRFPGTSLTATSFICQDTFQGGLLHPERFGTTNWDVKVEQGTDYSHQPNVFPDLKKPVYYSLSSIPEPGCAHSLLSSQSHNSTNHSSGIPMASPIMVPAGSIRSYSVGQFSNKLVGGLGSQASISNKFSSSGISLVDGSHVGHALRSDGSYAVNFLSRMGLT
ncbi:hypothetical protein ACFE04_006597 [Oxalis oulophora]